MALIAAAMSLVALSIDAMLPALEVIASDLGAQGRNDRQLVLTAFFAGLTGGQIVYGPLADALGRRRTMLFGLAVLLAGCSACALAPSFPVMLLGRFVAGLGAAGPRIVALAIVRDLYSGRGMARIMSYVTSIFILVPIAAPSVGQGVLLVASWRAIFGVLVGGALAVTIWFALRQPETLPPERRTPLAFRPVGAAFLRVLRTREALRYTLATGLVFAALIAYLGTAQQIFGEVYGRGTTFPLYFAALASSVGLSSILNGRLVERLGMRALSGGALRVSVGASGLFFALALYADGRPPFGALLAYLLVIFFCNGLLFGNFNALAMEPLGDVAGAAAAIIGTLTSLISTVIGTPIGRAYDGTVIPLVAGLFGMTSLALLIVLTGPRDGEPARGVASD